MNYASNWRRTSNDKLYKNLEILHYYIVYRDTLRTCMLQFLLIYNDNCVKCVTVEVTLN